MGKILICTIIIFLTVTSSTYAEDVSVLLRMYGVDTSSSAVVEQKKLHIVEGEYIDIAQKVSSNNMLGAANDLLLSYNSEKLVEMDKEIYLLSDKLLELESKMELNKDSSVETLLLLDSEYRSAQDLLVKKRKDRDLWAAQPEIGSSILNPTTEEDSAKLKELTSQVEKQREKYKKAVTFPDIGEITTFKSPLDRPVYVTSPFGGRLDPVTRQRIQFHKGTDMRASMGTKVLSAFKGTVADAGYGSSIGNFIVVDHGFSASTLYGHLSKIEVSIGQKVNQYEVIGRSGNSGGRSTGPHLHFAVYINGEAVDPQRLF